MVFCSDSTSAPDSIASTISSTVTSSSPLSPPASDRARSPAPAAPAPHTLSTPVPGSGGSPSPSPPTAETAGSPRNHRNRIRRKTDFKRRIKFINRLQQPNAPDLAQILHLHPRFANRLTMLQTSPIFSSASVSLAALSPSCAFSIRASVCSMHSDSYDFRSGPYISGCTPIFRFITTSVPIPDATLLPAHP